MIAAFAGTHDAPGSSDARLKTALQPIRNALEKVRQLHGTRYRWGDDGLDYLTRGIAGTVSAGPDGTDE